MMGWYGGFAGMGGLGGFAMIFGMLFWVALAALAIWALVALISPHPAPRQTESALDILKRRYAAGEISREEFQAARQDLA
ncbi:MAG: SHOCT domain-containing protein [Bacteroidetes bacterium]|nr:SHOCT domain-containing protein [Bacteroidota bacterium]MCL5026695.1 SHOCT domain-containing protein [Chloroflexota bacterium]